jgi:dipicolinate synthase subunit A
VNATGASQTQGRGEQPLRGLVVAVIGGDGRELEVLRGLLVDGASVRACGCPPAAAEIMGHAQCATLAEAIAGADFIIAPVPVIAPDGSLYAPHWPAALYPDASAFADVKRGAWLIIGTSTPALNALAQERGFRIYEYGDDDELMILRAPTIAEGAIGLTIANTDIAIHDAQVLVIGFGRIGFTLTRLLLNMGAHVRVAARNPVQRARAWELGARPLPLEALAEAVGAVDMVFNTVPAPVLTRAVLERMRQDVFILDIASAPGGSDFAAAQELGLKALLGRGLGSRAPKTAGRSQWQGIRRVILAALSERSQESGAGHG